MTGHIRRARKRPGFAALVAAFTGLSIAIAGCTASGSSGPVGLRTPHPSLQGDGPPCRLVYGLPYFDVATTCSEVIYDNVITPEAAPNLAALAFGPDGTLYLVHTAAGTIAALRDADTDTFPVEEQIVAEGLTLPTSVAATDDALIVLSVGGLLRLDRTPGGRFDAVTVLARDLPAGDGFWPGSVRVGPDGRLYVSLGAGCETCADRPGLLVSYAPDGSDQRIEATGLRNPRDFDWNPATGELWIADNGRLIPGAETSGPPDEINRLPSDADRADLNFGFPYCGANGQPLPGLDSSQAATCAGTQPPDVTFPAQSGPSGIAFYTFDGYPFWQGALLVALRGSWDVPEPTGYGVAVVTFGADGLPDGGLDWVAPTTEYGSPFQEKSLSNLSLSGMGFFPFHPSDVVVSAEGWIYVALEEGRILRYRPRPSAYIDPITPTPP